MLALLYLLAATLVGAMVVHIVWPWVWAPMFERSLCRDMELPLPPWMVFWPAAWISGTLLFGWASFFWAEAAVSILSGGLGVLAVSLTGLSALTVWMLRKRRWRASVAALPRPTGRIEGLYLLFALLLALFIALRTFSVEEGALRIGATVFSDFGPHLAVIRSFSEGLNFPPQYPHFPDGSMRYHFMFQFHVATLEALGLRLDWAFNLPSVLGLTACLTLLYALAVGITGRRAVGVLAGILFMFRSSFAVFTHAHSQWGQPDFWAAVWNPSVHIGQTTNESWGLFAQNVYANQRHFGFALAVMWLVLMATLPLLRARLDAVPSFRGFWLSGANWWPERHTRPVVLGVLLGAIAYWNGAVVLAALMVLLGIGFFARHRLEFALIAALALGLSAFQWSSFVGAAGVTPAARWLFGFLATDKSPLGVAMYYFELLGIFLPLFFWAALRASRGERALAVALLFPLMFATTIALTVDINANHKFIMISVALGNILVAALLVEMFGRPALWLKAIAVMSLVLLTATGVVDLRTLQIMNRSGLHFAFDDPMLGWVRRTTAPTTVFLTHWSTLNPVLLAGRPIYYGWPYYAWSAGHATQARELRFRAVYAAEDSAGLRQLAQAEGIAYIVVDRENRHGREYPVNEAVIAATFPLVFSHPEREVRIYRVQP